MTDRPARPTRVLLPVGGVEDHHAGIAFAAQEAVRRGCDIDVLHVALPAAPEDGSAVLDLAETIVERTVEATRRSLGRTGPTVRGRVARGDVVPALVEDSRQAALVVLTRRHARGAVVPSAMTVANALGAHAHAPVAVVPPRWSPGTTSAPVVVGVGDGRAESRVVLQAGLEQARRCRARAEVVHGWWYSDAYDDLVLGGAPGTAETARRQARLAAELAPVLAEFRDLDVRLRVEHTRPARLLLDATENAQLVVLGRHRPLLPFGSELGQLTRTVISGAACPALVVGAPGPVPPAGP